ncbi:conserved hypothetical protein [Ricinus communis]|uniref:Uncharacterized protein n=1 Tax=Ricinus communis TaxID=3988 RepID=B9SXA1_RICCO|nr:conserved hypothetical protein [Ricinus communis]
MAYFRFTRNFGNHRRSAIWTTCSQVQQMKGCWVKFLPSVPSQSSYTPGTLTSLLTPYKSNLTIHSSPGSGSKCAKSQICRKRKAKQKMEAKERVTAPRRATRLRMWRRPMEARLVGEERKDQPPNLMRHWIGPLGATTDSGLGFLELQRKFKEDRESKTCNELNKEGRLKRIGRAIRKLRKEAESTLLSAQGDQGFSSIRPTQAYS